MAEETTEAQEATTTETDWKAKYEKMREHSREWEKKAKANQSAADELEKQRADSQTEQQRAMERAERAEAELQKLRDEAERSRIVAAVSSSQGVPADLVSMLNGADEDELSEQVDRIRKVLLAAPARTDDGGGRTVAKKSIEDRFAENLGL